MAFRKFTKRFFIITNVIIVALFLLACANAFLHPERWWFFAILGLAFPFLLLATGLFSLLWLLFRSRWIFLSLAALALGYTNIRALMAFHFSEPFKAEKEARAIRVLSWNVKWFDEQTKEDKGRESNRQAMLDFIRESDADILCFQEYFEPTGHASYNNSRELARMGYPYCFKVVDFSRPKNYEVGVAIFSRFPITDSLRVRYNTPIVNRAAESLIACTINVEGQDIRVFTTHLQSVLLQKKDYRDLAIIRKAEDSMMEASRSIVRKLKQGYQMRGGQVDTVRSLLDKSQLPEVICGDYNDVPNSYTYFRIRGDRQDAFVEKSSGLGRTFATISSTLRIDYIMADRRFEVLQYKRHLLPYSDHYPVVADLRLAAAQ
ncbi:MAG: endonuclease/exonuclease/phosphatase family protein [Candidatus Pseudobacter hemicellulosilyticus]|uniref:Endonuclease/exonuclease/phosphatase family protein n=1 Tax=Candidatus Pseudobacter hemicellulosilyticus TaxID=3121375 RepID=A0AAJ5WX14_9BACT|nr:MAG: endonuclease/exonuclease/phosphatase family protein [Pseudobacter sp.]